MGFIGNNVAKGTLFLGASACLAVAAKRVKETLNSEVKPSAMMRKVNAYLTRRGIKVPVLAKQISEVALWSLGAVACLGAVSLVGSSKSSETPSEPSKEPIPAFDLTPYLDGMTSSVKEWDQLYLKGYGEAALSWSQINPGKTAGIAAGLSAMGLALWNMLRGNPAQALTVGGSAFTAKILTDADLSNMYATNSDGTFSHWLGYTNGANPPELTLPRTLSVQLPGQGPTREQPVVAPVQPQVLQDADAASTLVTSTGGNPAPTTPAVAETQTYAEVVTPGAAQQVERATVQEPTTLAQTGDLSTSATYTLSAQSVDGVPVLQQVNVAGQLLLLQVTDTGLNVGPNVAAFESGSALHIAQEVLENGFLVNLPGGQRVFVQSPRGAQLVITQLNRLDGLADAGQSQLVKDNQPAAQEASTPLSLGGALAQEMSTIQRLEVPAGPMPAALPQLNLLPGGRLEWSAVQRPSDRVSTGQSPRLLQDLLIQTAPAVPEPSSSTVGRGAAPLTAPRVLPAQIDMPTTPSPTPQPQQVGSSNAQHSENGAEDDGFTVVRSRRAPIQVPDSTQDLFKLFSKGKVVQARDIPSGALDAISYEAGNYYLNVEGRPKPVLLEHVLRQKGFDPSKIAKIKDFLSRHMDSSTSQAFSKANEKVGVSQKKQPSYGFYSALAGSDSESDGEDLDAPTLAASTGGTPAPATTPVVEAHTSAEVVTSAAAQQVERATVQESTTLAQTGDLSTSATYTLSAQSVDGVPVLQEVNVAGQPLLVQVTDTGLNVGPNVEAFESGSSLHIPKQVLENGFLVNLPGGPSVFVQSPREAELVITQLNRLDGLADAGQGQLVRGDQPAAQEASTTLSLGGALAQEMPTIQRLEVPAGPMPAALPQLNLLLGGRLEWSAVQRPSDRVSTGQSPRLLQDLPTQGVPDPLLSTVGRKEDQFVESVSGTIDSLPDRVSNQVSNNVALALGALGNPLVGKLRLDLLESVRSSIRYEMGAYQLQLESQEWVPLQAYFREKKTPAALQAMTLGCLDKVFRPQVHQARLTAARSAQRVLKGPAQVLTSDVAQPVHKVTTLAVRSGGQVESLGGLKMVRAVQLESGQTVYLTTNAEGEPAVALSLEDLDKGNLFPLRAQTSNDGVGVQLEDGTLFNLNWPATGQVEQPLIKDLQPEVTEVGAASNRAPNQPLSRSLSDFPDLPRPFAQYLRSYLSPNAGANGYDPLTEEAKKSLYLEGGMPYVRLNDGRGVSLERLLDGKANSGQIKQLNTIIYFSIHAKTRQKFPSQKEWEELVKPGPFQNKPFDPDRQFDDTLDQKAFDDSWNGDLSSSFDRSATAVAGTTSAQQSPLVASSSAAPENTGQVADDSWGILGEAANGLLDFSDSTNNGDDSDLFERDGKLFGAQTSPGSSTHQPAADDWLASVGRQLNNLDFSDSDTGDDESGPIQTSTASHDSGADRELNLSPIPRVDDDAGAQTPPPQVKTDQNNRALRAAQRSEERRREATEES